MLNDLAEAMKALDGKKVLFWSLDASSVFTFTRLGSKRGSFAGSDCVCRRSSVSS